MRALLRSRSERAHEIPKPPCEVGRVAGVGDLFHDGTADDHAISALRDLADVLGI